MSASKITDIAVWRATHARPISDACRWSQAFETVFTTHVRLAFALQRTILRAMWRI